MEKQAIGVAQDVNFMGAFDPQIRTFNSYLVRGSEGVAVMDMGKMQEIDL